VSWGINLEDLAASRDVLRDELADRADSHTLEQLANAHRWLDEEDEARRRFAEAADAAEAEFARWEREDPSALSRIGTLRLRAGDAGAASGWLDRAAAVEDRPDRLAPLSYLRGDADAAARHARSVLAEEPPPYPWMDGIAALARARRDGDAAAAEEAVAHFATAVRADRTRPDEASGSADLSLLGWLDQAFRVRAALTGEDPPDHRAMLEAAGLLRAEPDPESRRHSAPPDLGPRTAGEQTIDYPQPGGGGRITPSLAVDEHGDLHFVLHPERDLRVSLVQAGDGRWRARVNGAEAPGSFRGPRAAKEAARDQLDALPDGEWAGALLDKLFRESFRL
jgi:hypothetical protein